MQQSGGLLLTPVQTLVATLIFGKAENANESPAGSPDDANESPVGSRPQGKTQTNRPRVMPAGQNANESTAGHARRAKCKRIDRGLFQACNRFRKIATGATHPRNDIGSRAHWWHNSQISRFTKPGWRAIVTIVI